MNFVPEEVLVRIILRRLISFFGDLVEVVARGDGGGERAAVEYFDAGVAASGELERNGAAPGACANDQDLTVDLGVHAEGVEMECILSSVMMGFAVEIHLPYLALASFYR
jgi:hypothetical protein